MYNGGGQDPIRINALKPLSKFKRIHNQPNKEIAMKRKIITRTLMIFATICFITAFVGTAQAQNAQKLRYTSSNQVYQAVDKLKVKTFAQESGIEVDVATGSSIWAMIQVMNGTSDIASSATELYKRHKERGFQTVAFCKDPLVVIGHKDCGVDSLTEEQVRNIFNGTITNWQTVGGEDQKITVIVPGEETAANRNFQRQFMKNQDIRYDIMARASVMAPTIVHHFPCGAISFIGQGAALKEPNIKALKIDGKSPQEPDYPYVQTFYYVTMGKARGAAKAFIDYTFSAAGQKMLKENGLIPVKK